MLVEDLSSWLIDVVVLADEKVFPNIGYVKAVPPYIVWEQVNKKADYTHDGASGLGEIKVRITCFSFTYLEAKNIADQVIFAMETWAASGVQGVFLTNDGPDGYDEESRRHFVPLEFTIKHKEV